MDEVLSKTINYDCFEPMVVAAKKAGVTLLVQAAQGNPWPRAEFWLVKAMAEHQLGNKPLARSSLETAQKFRPQQLRLIPAYRDPYDTLLAEAKALLGE